MPARDPWWDRAACRAVDPAIFNNNGSRARAGFTEAKALCGSCPVRLACLKDALAAPPVVLSDTEVSLGAGGSSRTQLVEFTMFQAGLTPEELTDLWYQVRAA